MYIYSNDMDNGVFWNSPIDHVCTEGRSAVYQRVRILSLYSIG